jgi:DNA polymerase-3 subunit delta'
MDNDEFDDFYVINPNTVGINTEEIEKLFLYMKTKSTRYNGRRVYIICGLERLSRSVSNKILKFLEEPVDNLYALLITENIDQLLSTIISRCQVIDLKFDNDVYDENLIKKMQDFLIKIKKCGTATIAYINDYFDEIIQDRIKIFESFELIEKLLSNEIRFIVEKVDSEYRLNEYNAIPLNTIVNIIDITNKLKKLIKQNINLNLLIDRYIIEVSKELEYAKNSRSSI